MMDWQFVSTIVFALGVMAFGMWIIVTKKQPAKADECEEMQELIQRGADAFTAWTDSQPLGYSDVNEPFGEKTGEMLQALSMMNDFVRREVD